MKNVLVLVHDDPGEDARLQAALDVTRTISGHLLCLHVVVPSEAIGRHRDDGDSAVVDLVRGRVSQHGARIKDRLQAEGVSWAIAETLGSLDSELIGASELADIIVLSGPAGRDNEQARHLIGEVAVKTRRPVLAVPPTCSRLDLGGAALVAWDGSRPANEALRSAVPLLQHASSVTLLEVNAPISQVSVSEAASYLSRHGVHAQVDEESTDRPLSETILDKAHAIAAAYVVIGAYGLPRWLESLFGGVTDGMLLKADLPILLAH